MIRWRAGVVHAVRRQWTGVVEVDVELEAGASGQTFVPALAYVELVGTPVR
ncbi:MAG: DUF3866 domain-containing protein, partial [Actinobacteria bacterium]|nr:DUF3866 domain-containing protein [Actinomycetota bacterium]